MSKESFTNLTEQDKIDICTKYEAGGLVSTIRDEYDLFYIELDSVLKGYSTPRRSMGESRKIISPEIESTIVSKYLSGDSMRSLAIEFGIDRTTVNRVLWSANVELHSKQEYNVKRLFDKDKICDLYVSGASMSVVAEQCGVSMGTVCLTLKERGIKARHNKGGLKGRKTCFTESQIDEMVCLYVDERMSVSKILKRFNSNTPTKQITKLLLKRGVQIRSKNDNNKTYFCDSDFFSDTNSQNVHYILGWIYTDGALRDNLKQNFSIELQEKDRCMVEYIKESLQADNPIYTTDKPSSILTIHDAGIYDSLSDLGLRQNKSKTLAYPDWVNNLYFFDFVRGVIEGDGSVIFHCDDSYVSFSVGFYGSSPMVVELAHELTTKHGIDLYNLKIGDNNRYIAQKREAAIRLGTLIYEGANMVLPRKFLSFRAAVEYFKTHGHIDKDLIFRASIAVENTYNRLSHLF